MSSMSLPIRLAGLALLLSVVSASAADEVAANDVVVWDSVPTLVATQPAVAAAQPAVVAAQPAALAPVAAPADRPVPVAAEKAAATDLGAARAAADRRLATPAPRIIRRAAPQPARFACSGIWCGRQFVLMLGTAY